jgi:hypothetical protein
MKIKILQGFAGTHGGYSQGAVVDMPDEIAKSYIACGYAEAMQGEPQEVKEAKPQKVKLVKAKALTPEG